MAGILDREEGGPDRLMRVDPVPEAMEKEAPTPVAAVVLLSVGGMLMFMGLFFLLIASIALGGFLVPALAIMAMAGLMMLAGWKIWRDRRAAHHEMQRQERDRLLCDYCGGMNAEGDLKCRFCGAPLR